MARGIFTFEIKVNQPIEKVWEFFSTAENIAQITTFPKVKILSAPETRIGNRIEMELNFIIFKKKWVAQIDEVVEQEYFIDRGVNIPFPFKTWVHTHSFEELGEWTIIRDQVKYESSLPNFINTNLLNSMFSGRARQIERELNGL